MQKKKLLRSKLFTKYNNVMEINKYIEKCITKSDIIYCTFILSYNCNAKCVFCYQQQHKYCNDTLDPKNAINILKYIKNNYKLEIIVHITGGEACLNINILNELTDFLIKEHIKYDIFTNGTLLDSKFDKILKHCYMLHLSVHGFTEEEREKIYKNKINSNIELVSKYKIPLYLHVNFLPIKYKNISDVFCNIGKMFGKQTVCIKRIEIASDMNIANINVVWNNQVNKYLLDLKKTYKYVYENGFYFFYIYINKVKIILQICKSFYSCRNITGSNIMFLPNNKITTTYKGKIKYLY